MKKAPEFRIRRTNIYVPGTYGLFRTIKAIDKNVDTIQYKDETEGWVDLPVEFESFRVYKDRIERDAY